MVFAETRHFCSVLQSQIVGTVLVDVVADGHEFFHVFLLFVAGCVKTGGIAVILPPDEDKEMQHFFINHGFR